MILSTFEYGAIKNRVPSKWGVKMGLTIIRSVYIMNKKIRQKDVALPCRSAAAGRFRQDKIHTGAGWTVHNEHQLTETKRIIVEERQSGS